MMDRERFLRMDDDGGGEYLRTGMSGSSSPSRSVPISSPPSAPVGVGADGGVNYIIHTVTRLDTLAGVAIKYGVEVADIKKLNGLVTDLQMFALNTLQIPLPGRHPPSPSLSNGHETPQRPNSSHQSASSRRYSDLFDSFPSLKLKASSEEKVSPAMSTLWGYYGLSPADQKGASEGFEMSVYRKEGAHYLEDGPFAKSSSPLSNPPLSHHRKSKSLANCLASQNGDLVDRLMSQEPESNNNDSAEKLVRRRQKSVADFSKCTPEKLLKNENNTNSITISSITGKGLALRTKSGSRGIDGETGVPSTIPAGLGDSVLTDNGNGVRKSSSTPSLQDSENGALLLSLWPTSKWSLKPDFQALSNAAIPKPSNRKNKAALD